MEYSITLDTKRAVSSRIIVKAINEYIHNNYLNIRCIANYINKMYKIVNLKYIYNIDYLLYNIKIVNNYFKYKEESENNQNITINIDYINNVLKRQIDCKVFMLIYLMLVFDFYINTKDVEIIRGINICYGGNEDGIEHTWLEFQYNNKNYVFDICDKVVANSATIRNNFKTIKYYTINVNSLYN